MDETFVIVGSDGTEHEFPAGMDPQKAAAIVRGQSPATAPPSAATEGMPEQSLPTDTRWQEMERRLQDVEVMGGPLMPPLAGVPGIVAGAGGKAWQAAQALAKGIATPAGGAVLGALEGGRHGGLTGAVTGAATGYVGGKTIPAAFKKLLGVPRRAPTPRGPSQASQQMVAGMSQVGRPMAPAPVAPTAPVVAPPSAPMATAGSSLVDEVAARQKLADPINWRTTDVTPIKKPGKGIHFGEESTPGLLRMLQDAQLAKDATLADKILKAIKQRSHITGKVGES